MTTEREIRRALEPIELRQLVAEEKLTQLVALFQLLIARITDPTRVTVGEAARILGISKSSVRRRFAPYIERAPGTKGDFIPVDKLYSGLTLPLEVAKKVVERVKRDAA